MAKPLKSFLSEAPDARPSAALIRKARIDGFYMHGDGIAKRLNDFEYKVVQLPVTALVTRERGFRHPLDKLIAAYKKNPASVTPIPVKSHNHSDRKFLILDGHHRRKAAILAGLTHVWCVIMKYQLGRESWQECKNCGHWASWHGDGTGREDFCQHYDAEKVRGLAKPQDMCGCTKLVL